MNYYEHHLGDWAKKCAHLTFAEEGCYRRLLDWYYANERPLPLELRGVRRIARANNTSERTVLDKVLREFFDPMPDGWHQSRVDKELESFEKRLPVTLLARDNMKTRARRARERRAELFAALDAAGVHAPWNTTNNALFDLFDAHGIEPPRAGPVTAPDTAPDTESLSTNHQAPGGSSGEPLAVSGPLRAPDPAARVACAKALRKAGFAAVNPLDPRFFALVDRGAQPEEFAFVAAEALAKGKGWAWLLATVRGRREDAARQTAMPQEAPQTARQRAQMASLEAWTPQLARKPLEGV